MKYKKNNRGFTLVELIVVLVILAVLAALLVPSLTGYIDKAKEKSVIAETRMILQAVQTEVSELYGTDKWVPAGVTFQTIASKDGKRTDSNYQTENVPALKERYDKIVSLSEVSSLANETGHFFAITTLQGKVFALVYNDGQGHLGFYHSELGEYLVFSTDEASDSIYSSLFNSVRVQNLIDSDGEPDPLWTPDTMIAAMTSGNS